MFIANSRSSSEHGAGEVQNGHKRSDSAMSDGIRQAPQDAQRPSGSIDSEVS